jgi:hypothetical protein
MKRVIGLFPVLLTLSLPAIARHPGGAATRLQLVLRRHFMERRPDMSSRAGVFRTRQDIRTLLSCMTMATGLGMR